MDFWVDPAWQISLSAVIPPVLALLLFVVEARGPLARRIQSTTGIVGPYFSSIAIVFGLFSALLASDAWQKDTLARRMVHDEADAARVIAQFSRATGIEATVLPKLKAYVAASSAEEAYAPTMAAARAKTEKAYEELLTTLVGASALDTAARGSLIRDARDMMRAHDDRYYLANDITAPVKWLAIVIFGFLTQVALMLVHAGQRRAMRVAVSLFTVAFSSCLIVMAIFDSPFDGVLSDEPKTSLGAVLKTL